MKNTSVGCTFKNAIHLCIQKLLVYVQNYHYKKNRFLINFMHYNFFNVCAIACHVQPFFVLFTFTFSLVRTNCKKKCNCITNRGSCHHECWVRALNNNGRNVDKEPNPVNKNHNVLPDCASFGNPFFAHQNSNEFWKF